MCYHQPIEGHMNYSVKPKLICCCRCYFDTFFLARFDGEKWHDKILDRIKIDNKRYLFSVLLNSESRFSTICWKHVSYQMIYFNDVQCDDYFSLTFGDSTVGFKKLFCKGCFRTQCSRHFGNLTMFVFKLLKNI